MGDYIQLADLKTRLDAQLLIAFSDDENSGLPDETVLEQAIADAEGEINSYAQARYSIPLAPVEGVIKKLALDITAKNLYARRGRMPEEIRDLYRDAVDWLKRLSEGKVSLSAGTSQTAEELTSGAGVVGGGERLFTRETLKDS